MRDEVKIQTPGYLWIVRFVAVVLGTATTFMALDLDNSTPTALSLLAGAYAFAMAALVWRVRRYSITLNDDELIVRNLIKTYRLPRSRVTAITPVLYSGYLNLFRQNEYLTTLRVTAEDQHVTASGLITMPDRAQNIAGRLETSLGIESGNSGR